MFALLLWSGISAYAYPMFPKTYFTIGDGIHVHEVRAVVEEPTTEDYARRTLGWPVTSDRGRVIEAAAEAAFREALVDVVLERPPAATYAVAQRLGTVAWACLDWPTIC